MKIGKNNGKFGEIRVIKVLKVLNDFKDFYIIAAHPPRQSQNKFDIPLAYSYL